MNAPAASALIDIEIFKTGRHTAMNGQTLTFTPAICDQIVANFDPKKTAAPICIGHPKHDSPSYGWVESVRMEGGVMKAKVRAVDAQFINWVKEGRYKRISAAFFGPDSPSNPNPNQFTLKHVGFLGGASPAVTGMKQVEFQTEASDQYVFGDNDIGNMSPEMLKRLLRIENEQLVADLQREGKLLPVFKQDVLAFMDTLSGETLMFSEAGAQVASLDWFRSYLAKQPKHVTMGKMQFSAASNEAAYDAYDLPAGYQADTEALGLRNRAQSIMADKGCSFEVALKEAQRG